METTFERLSPCSLRRSDPSGYGIRILAGCGALLLCGSAFAQSLVNGGGVSGTLSAPGETHTYTFVTQQRDWFEMRLVNVSGSSFTPRLELINPNGVLLGTYTDPDVAVIDTRQVLVGTLTRPGTYTVIVSDASAAPGQTGTYDLHFVRVPGANAGGELLDGVTVFGEIERGELDTFTFHAEAGQTFQGTVVARGGSTLRMRVEKYSANGHATGIGPRVEFSGGDSSGGIQTLVISDAGGTGTGRYTLVVHGASAAPPYPPSVFWPSQYSNDPWLLDNAGNPGLGPRIGDPAEPFNVSIDCTGASTPSIYALSLWTDNRSTPLSTRWGLLYLDGYGLLSQVGWHSRSVRTWFPTPTGFPLPDDMALVGRSYTVQGLCGGFGGSIRLSNAITQTIGN